MKGGVYVRERVRATSGKGGVYVWEVCGLHQGEGDVGGAGVGGWCWLCQRRVVMERVASTSGRVRSMSGKSGGYVSEMALRN